MRLGGGVGDPLGIAPRYFGDGSGRLPAMQDENCRAVDKPWGGELWFAHTDRYAGKLLHVKAGERLSVQYHAAKDDSFLLSGRLVLQRGPSADSLVETELGPGGVWRNEPGEVHSVEALEDSAIVEVSTPELEDVVRLSDDYGRALGGNSPQRRGDLLRRAVPGTGGAATRRGGEWSWLAPAVGLSVDDAGGGADRSTSRAAARPWRSCSASSRSRRPSGACARPSTGRRSRACSRRRRSPSWCWCPSWRRGVGASSG